jgi:Cation transporter/ATPase, N-terminus
VQRPLAPQAGVAAPHREPAGTVVSTLGSDAERGLTRADAERRLAEQGPNRLDSAPEVSWWRHLLEQLASRGGASADSLRRHRGGHGRHRHQPGDRSVGQEVADVRPQPEACAPWLVTCGGFTL